MLGTFTRFKEIPNLAGEHEETFENNIMYGSENRDVGHLLTNLGEPLPLSLIKQLSKPLHCEFTPSS